MHVDIKQILRHLFEILYPLDSGADPGFFLGGGALVSCSTSTPINHIVFFLQNTSCIRKPQVISGRGAHPLHPPPRSAPGQGRIQDFFRRGCTRLLLYFNTNKPHSSFFFLQNTSCIRKPQVISGGEGAPPAPSP